jgi:hypothetical protein
VTTYRSRTPWWRTETAGLILSATGYLVLLVAVCTVAGLLL